MLGSALIQDFLSHRKIHLLPKARCMFGGFRMVGAVPPRFQVSERLMTCLCFGVRRKAIGPVGMLLLESRVWRDRVGGVNETVIRERRGKGCRLQQHVFHFSPTAHFPQLQPFSVSQFLFSLGCCLRH